MRLTKKAAALLVAATMVVSMGATPVLALDASSKTKGTQADTEESSMPYTNLEYNVSQTYTWTVPSKVNFENGSNYAGAVNTALEGTTTDSTGMKVSVSNNVIPKGKNLKITVKGDGGQFTIKTAETNPAVLTYKITVEDTNNTYKDLTNNLVVTVPAGTQKKDQPIKFTLNTTAENGNTAVMAGDYTGKAIFTAAVE